MPSPHAHMACVLEVNMHCDACIRHAIEVLYSVDGVYDVEFDSGTKTATIIGEVEPNFCLKALARCGYHAAIKHVKLTHPRISSMGSYDPSYPRFGRSSYPDHGHIPPHTLGYGADPYQRSLPGMWHDYPTRSALPYSAPRYGGPTSSHYDPPYARDSYDYNTYGHGGGMCNIM